MLYCQNQNQPSARAPALHKINRKGGSPDHKTGGEEAQIRSSPQPLFAKQCIHNKNETARRPQDDQVGAQQKGHGAGKSQNQDLQGAQTVPLALITQQNGVGDQNKGQGPLLGKVTILPEEGEESHKEDPPPEGGLTGALRIPEGAS